MWLVVKRRVLVVTSHRTWSSSYIDCIRVEKGDKCQDFVSVLIDGRWVTQRVGPAGVTGCVCVTRRKSRLPSERRLVLCFACRDTVWTVYMSIILLSYSFPVYYSCSSFTVSVLMVVKAVVTLVSFYRWIKPVQYITNTFFYSSSAYNPLNF